MSTKIFVNLTVKNLKKSMDFYKTIGYSFNPQFTDETAACMIISEHIYAMLLTEEKCNQVMPKEIVESGKLTEVMTCLSAESKEKVNEIVDKAINAGATEPREPEDYGFMFRRNFNDIDGHIWDFMWMDENYAEAQ